MNRRQFIGMTLPAAAGLTLYPNTALDAAVLSDFDMKIAGLKSILKREGLSLAYFDDTRFKIYPDVIRISNPKKKKESTPKEKEAEDARKKSYFDKRIAWLQAEGERFYKAHEANLLEAEETTGPSRFYIAAIIGIESDYATKTGIHLAFNALASLYFSERERMQNIAAINLPALARVSEKMDLKHNNGNEKYSGVFVQSSWAGAIGYAQFMPANLDNNWFISSDMSRKPDPFNLKDCFFSIGNYFRINGWNAENNHLPAVYELPNGRAIFHYNKSREYFEYVSGTAEHLRNKFS